jgi:hypothetical protein
MSEENQNLTAGQKLLLEWHARFGHRNFASIQRLMRFFPFTSQKFGAAAKCDIPCCSVCEFAKAKRRPNQSQRTTKVPERDGALTKEHLIPGTQVSCDHFESRLRGCTYDSYGKTTSAQYVGGCIFVDHGSGYVNVQNRLGFSAVETIRAKQSFEQFALGNGVIVQNYLTDSGAFKANKFVKVINDTQQRLRFCGNNAHHQNGVGERSIQTVSNLARTKILHASMHWKDGVDASFWPMVVQYATHIYNNTPGDNGVCPTDIFTGGTVPRHRLHDVHVWGSPVYVLDPKLKQGQKLPRWQPRSRRGIF